MGSLILIINKTIANMKIKLGLLVFSALLVQGYSLKCYECNSWENWQLDCAHDGNENIGELVECADSPNMACITSHRYLGLTARGCSELPHFNFIGDQDCVMKYESNFDAYYFNCYCFTDECNTLDDPPCGVSDPGACDPIG